MTLPDSSFLPAPLWVITALHVLTLSLHFTAMNFLLGGTLIVLTGRFERRWENPTIRRFVALFPSAMAATVTLGVAPLLFLQLVYPRQMYAAAIVSGWFWFLVIIAVIGAYYLLYAASFSGKEGASRKVRFLFWPALFALLYVSLVYSSVFSMAENPNLIQRLYAQNQTGFQWNPELGNYFLRWLHMILGAVTVGAYFVGLLGKDDPEASPVAKRLFAYGMIAAATAGFAYLVSLKEILPGFMRTPAIWALSVGILLSLGSLHFFYKRRFLASGLALFVSLLLMVMSRHQLRLLKLQGHFAPASWRIAPQWFPFLLFLVCFVIAAILAVYMLRLFVNSRLDSP